MPGVVAQFNANDSNKLLTSRQAFERNLPAALAEHGFSVPVAVSVLGVTSGSIVIDFEVADNRPRSLGFSTDEVAQLKGLLEPTPGWMKTLALRAIAEAASAREQEEEQEEEAEARR